MNYINLLTYTVAPYVKRHLLKSKGLGKCILLFILFHLNLLGSVTNSGKLCLVAVDLSLIASWLRARAQKGHMSSVYILKDYTC